jgi:hypothetical protein
MNQNLLTYYYRTFLYSAVPVVDFCPIRDVHCTAAICCTVLSLQAILSRWVPMSDHVPLLVDLGPADHADEQLHYL